MDIEAEMSRFCKFLVPLLFFGLVIGLAGSAQASVQASGPISEKDLASRIDRLLSDVYKPDGPGAAILVKKQGKVIWRKGYGLGLDLHRGLGEKEQALEKLEKAYTDWESIMAHLGIWPVFDSLRSEPRFKELLHKMGLDQ
jgi:hypothetical protein